MSGELIPDLDAYQTIAYRYAYYKSKGYLHGLEHTTLGLNGEAGEIANLVKEISRNAGTYDKIKLEEQIGDALWWIAALASEANISLEDAARRNLKKLREVAHARTNPDGDFTSGFRG